MKYLLFLFIAPVIFFTGVGTGLLMYNQELNKASAKLRQRRADHHTSYRN